MAKNNMLLVYGLVAVLAIAYIGGAFASFGLNSPLGYSWFTAPATQTSGTVPGSGAGTGITGQVVPGSLSAHAQWNIRDALTKTATAAGDTGYVGVVRADTSGKFDFLNPVEVTEFDAAPDTSAGIYTTGDKLILVVSSDNDPTTGDETYPRWFYINSLTNGADIFAFPLSNPKSALTEYPSGSQYKYSVNTAALVDTGENVNWLEGTTPYWVMGSYFEVYGRVDNAGLIQQIVSGGVVGTTLNDGATWEDTDGEIDVNLTAVSDSEDISVELIGQGTDVAWGLPYLGVGVSGQVYQYEAVIIVSTNATAISTQSIIDDGWTQVNKVGMTDHVMFYHTVNPVTDGCIPATGNVLHATYTMTLQDTGLGASEYEKIYAWVLDGQRISNVAVGTTSTTVGASGVHGVIAEYGLDSVVEPRGIGALSSGAPTEPQLYCHWITNA